MPLLDWLWDILNYLGFYEKVGKILFLGLDNAGKTTLLGKLSTDQVQNHRPTMHPNVEDLSLGGIKLKTFDLGGHAAARRLWRDYFTKADAVVFMVDAASPERFPEVRIELDELLQAEEIIDSPFLILGNKIDMTNRAVSEEELKAAIGISGRTTGKGPRSICKGIRPMEVFMCSVVKRTGYGDGFRWLSSYLKSQ
ncbi:Small GTPase superfamily ARF/SAR type [Perkinsela sp. CCAP 1560/4]|nr:ADP-ribosylation factor [Perkinsela sp. CCAP 1560/4]KNH08729.1 Small GTPase superfamily ARF/SAR type [Perkinsela sp. CCAP 1560/4]|eukprot:KNH04739.1 ADP-ribosylation factor [Perkinsela sp. CCAP 1560/4]